MATLLAIDIGGTNTVFSVVNQEAEILFTDSVHTSDFLSVDVLANVIKSHIPADLLQNLLAIGIAAPAADYQKGILNNPTNLNFKGEVPIKQIFETVFGLPVLLDNDARVAALGEWYFGAAKGLKNFVVLTIGSGVGSGVICNGQVLRGKNGFAGEIGHTIVEQNGRACNCGRNGCLERYISAGGIVKTYLEILNSKRKTPLDNVSCLDMMNLAKNGDEDAIEAFSITGKALGFALANLTAILDLEAIFLFGGPLKAGNLLLDPAKKSFDDNVLWLFKDKVKIEISSLMDKNAAILGAAALAWDKVCNSKSKK